MRKPNVSGRLPVIVLGLTLMTGLTACGDDGDDAGPGWVAGARGKAGAPVLDGAEQVAQALPSKVGVPEGWSAHTPRLLDGSESAAACQEEAGTVCVGLHTAGRVKLVGERPDPDGEGTETAFARFAVLAFDTPENAAVAHKMIAAALPRNAEGPVKPVKPDAGADETAAFAETKDGKSTPWAWEAVLRVGGTVVRIECTNLAGDAEFEKLAKLQVERVRKVAAGEHPDA
ncbi:hypothetical protein [Streptomyces sp. NPDC047725]|uniref:hypothetical protein n=1 Tax=Streptomyces sp. NPDC047725 TaxID=3365487 RepID=UPI003714D3B3